MGFYCRNSVLSLPSETETQTRVVAVTANQFGLGQDFQGWLATCHAVTGMINQIR